MTRVDPELEKKTFWLLRRIKRFFQSFSFKEDDLSMVNDWAEALEPVIDWTPRGLTLYVQDTKSNHRKKEPFVSDIRARNLAESEKQAREYGDIDPESCSSYITAKNDLSEAEQLENQKYQRPKLEALAARLYACNEDLCRWTALNGKKRHFQPEDSPFRKKPDDLPFTPDEDQIEQFESDSEE